MQVIKDSDNQRVYLVSKVESTGNGFKMSYRTYDLQHECGGYETTIIVNNASVTIAPSFTGMKHEVKATAKVFGAEIVKMTVNNIVSEKFNFRNIKNQLN